MVGLREGVGIDERHKGDDRGQGCFSVRGRRL